MGGVGLGGFLVLKKKKLLAGSISYFKFDEPCFVSHQNTLPNEISRRHVTTNFADYSVKSSLGPSPSVLVLCSYEYIIKERGGLEWDPLIWIQVRTLKAKRAAQLTRCLIQTLTMNQAPAITSRRGLILLTGI